MTLSLGAACLLSSEQSGSENATLCAALVFLSDISIVSNLLAGVPIFWKVFSPDVSIVSKRLAEL